MKDTCSDGRHCLESVRKVRSMVGELSRPGTREEGEVRECSSRDSGKAGVERLGRMNSRT